MAARNMYRIEINIQEKKCASNWLITRRVKWIFFILEEVTLQLNLTEE